MKFCYVDESGTSKSEPFAVMAGFFVDAQRMNVTKYEWRKFLEALSETCGRKIEEFHAKEFYPGNSIWRKLNGDQRTRIIQVIFEWLNKRKHKILFTGVDVKQFLENKEKCPKLRIFHSVWCFLGLHIILTVQKYAQGIRDNKGNTLFIFDNEIREETHFPKLLKNPPSWTDYYYSRKRKQETFDQVIDVPYFGDSKNVPLIQIADLIAYYLRRYIEIKENVIPPKFPDEEEKIDECIVNIVDLSLPVATRYPAVSRDEASELFYEYAPKSLRELGR